MTQSNQEPMTMEEAKELINSWENNCDAAMDFFPTAKVLQRYKIKELLETQNFISRQAQREEDCNIIEGFKIMPEPHNTIIPYNLWERGLMEIQQKILKSQP